MIWCLHGAVGMAEDWKELSATLGQGGHVVRRVDLWRFLDCCPMELDEFAKSFCEEVRASGDDENVLVGYSMGGRLALHALLEDADLFRAAVIVSAHPGGLDEKEKIIRMAGDAEWAGKALVGDWAMFLKEWDGQAVLNPEGGTLEGLGDRMQLKVRRQAVARSFMDWSLGKQGDLRSRFEEVKVPVLWVTGERDGKFTGLAKEAVPYLEEGRLEVVEGAGHRVPWEKSEEFGALVEEFLARF
ncbi:MAG: alpha/beta fold hydrolase [Akkermansiaceae bacterium]|nr:alpha/beta fold hydrolase [Akkermansiaceae bacterium]